jgi:hypothetical protein
VRRESFIISCIRRLREYGEGIVLADQSISSLKEVAKSNVYTIICLSQSSQRDRREVMNVLGLSPQQGDVTNKLKEGQGIIRLAARYPYPALLKFPFVTPKNLSDKEIDDMNANNEVINNLLKRVQVRHMDSNDLESGNRAINISHKKIKGESSNKNKKDLKLLLETVSEHPFDVSTQIMKTAGFSGSKGDRIKTIALEKDYILEHKISVGVRGGMRKYLEIIEKGYRLLDELCIEYQLPRGKGSFEHKLYQNIVAQNYISRGCHAKIEQQEYLESRDKDGMWTLADVGVKDKNGQNIAVEIELNLNSQIVANIDRDLRAGFDRIVVVTKKCFFDGVEKKVHPLSENIRDHVDIQVISGFL